MVLTFPLMVASRRSPRGSAVSPVTASPATLPPLSRMLLYVMVLLLFVANTINVAADLGAMGDATSF